MNQELYEILKKSIDSTGLPVMNTSQFVATVDKFGKEDFRKTLAEYITNEKPPYPLKKFSVQKVIDTFYKLQKANFVNYISTSDKEVLEKYNDYKYP